MAILSSGSHAILRVHELKELFYNSAADDVQDTKPDDETENYKEGHLDDSDTEESSGDSRASEKTESSNDRVTSVRRRVQFITSVAAVGGFLSGYNTGVISGAMLLVQRNFDLSRRQVENTVASTVLAAFLASLVGGTLHQRIGRRGTLMTAASIFVVGALLLMFTQNFIMLLIGQMCMGTGVGLESLSSPLYVSEISKPSIRAKFVSMYAMLLCFGQVFAGVIAGVFSGRQNGWRFMYGCSIFPAICMLVGYWFLPETPVQLFTCGKDDEAKNVLTSVRETDDEVESEMREIKSSLRCTENSLANVSTNQCNENVPVGADENPHTSKTLFERLKHLIMDAPTRRALMVGCSLMVLQQICGPNAVLYYSASIYQMAQFDESTSIWLAALTSASQIIGLVLSVALVDKAGRRTLTLTSLTLVSISSLGLGFSFYLAKIASGTVDLTLSDDMCSFQKSLVWSGTTSHCYDCVQIPGCGYCGGACVSQSVLGLEIDTCPAGSEWINEGCSNPFGWLSVLFMLLFLLFFGVGMGGKFI